MIRIEAVSRYWSGFSLKDISLDITAGEYFVLLGESGAGKTVLLEVLMGLLTPDRGRIFVEDKDVTKSRIQDRPFALVYQDQMLFPHMTVRRNIEYPLGGGSRKEVERLAEMTGCFAWLDRWPSEISIGQAQRVALARALAARPRCLLLDEPLASLDVPARAAMRSCLRKLHREGQTIVHVTHDHEEALAMADRVGIMEDGALAQVGIPEEVFHHPRSTFAARFIGIRNYFRGEACQGPSGVTVFRPEGHSGVEIVLADGSGQGRGGVVVRSEDIILSREKPVTSARNVLQGSVLDIERTRTGAEVMVNAGVPMAVMVTGEAVRLMNITAGSAIWLSFKASAVRFIAE